MSKFDDDLYCKVFMRLVRQNLNNPIVRERLDALHAAIKLVSETSIAEEVQSEVDAHNSWWFAPAGFAKGIVGSGGGGASNGIIVNYSSPSAAGSLMTGGKSTVGSSHSVSAVSAVNPTKR